MRAGGACCLLLSINSGRSRGNLSGLRKRRKMRAFLITFWQEESGQDLIEYTLLMAFVALASASLFISAGGNVSSIWSSANTQLTNAAGQASS
jgi:Flp pilus assembly pilin Flp